MPAWQTSSGSSGSPDDPAGSLPDSSRRAWWWLAPPLVLAFLTFLPITRNYFWSDDFLEMFLIADLPPLDFVLKENAGHTPVARNLVFLLHRHLFGPNPEYFFWAALLTHLVNVGLLWCVVRRLTGSARLAAFGAAVWGTCPSQEGALGWYSVYGRVMMSTALLAFLAHVTAVRARGTKPGWVAVTGWYLLALVASTCLSEGAAMALMFPFAIVLLLPQWRSWWRWPPLLPLWLIIPGSYAALIWRNQLLELPWVSKPTGQVLANVPIAIPSTLRLMEFGLERLVVGFLPVAPATPRPGYVVLAFFLVAGIALAWRAPVTVRKQLLACFVLATSAYGAIALGRGVLVMKVTQEQMRVLAHYQYTPRVSITLALCLLLNQAGWALRIPAALKNGAFAVWLSATAAAVVLMPLNIDHHDNERLRAADALERIKVGIYARQPGENVFFGAGPWTWWMFVIFYPENTVDGRRVYFLSDYVFPPRLVRTRTPTLLYPSAEAALAAAASAHP